MLPTPGPFAKGQFIHINPHFKNGVLQKLKNASNANVNLPLPTSTHINPLFMNPPTASTTIHMNPQFLNKDIIQPDAKNPADILQQEEKISSPLRQESKSSQLNKIISKSRTRLVRESHSQMKAPVKSTPPSNKPILLLTKRKLIRAPTASTLNSISNDLIRKKQRLKMNNKVYPLTGIVPILKRRPCAFVARYALRRSNSIKKSDFLTSIGRQKKKQLDTSMASVNKQLRLVNINGILYKSTGNTLQRKIESNPPKKPMIPMKVLQTTSKSRESISKSTKSPLGRTLYVRGAKYIMDPMGFKLTRVTQSNTSCQPSSPALTPKSTLTRKSLPRRIDIGGVTYMASGQSNNVLLRTSTHLVLAHLNHAKQRSVHVLSRSLTKTNKPCLIFQRLGKCAALERNRCSKVHDKQRIIVCPKFLQGVCFNTSCLLSHNKTLQKMPVCRFFLQGSCVRTDCPYLHKKLSDDSEICEDFRRGFCVLGEQCNKQHIFSRVKPKTNVNHESHDTSSSTVPSTTTETTVYRYFNGERFVLETQDEDTSDSDSTDALKTTSDTERKSDEDSGGEDDHDSSNIENDPGLHRKRKHLGTLPSFIPLS